MGSATQAGPSGLFSCWLAHARRHHRGCTHSGRSVRPAEYERADQDWPTRLEYWRRAPRGLHGYAPDCDVSHSYSTPPPLFSKLHSGLSPEIAQFQRSPDQPDRDWHIKGSKCVYCLLTCLSLVNRQPLDLEDPLPTTRDTCFGQYLCLSYFRRRYLLSNRTVPKRSNPSSWPGA